MQRDLWGMFAMRRPLITWLYFQSQWNKGFSFTFPSPSFHRALILFRIFSCYSGTKSYVQTLALQEYVKYGEIYTSHSDSTSLLSKNPKFPLCLQQWSKQETQPKVNVHTVPSCGRLTLWNQAAQHWWIVRGRERRTEPFQSRKKPSCVLSCMEDFYTFFHVVYCFLYVLNI